MSTPPLAPCPRHIADIPATRSLAASPLTQRAVCRSNNAMTFWRRGATPPAGAHAPRSGCQHRRRCRTRSGISDTRAAARASRTGAARQQLPVACPLLSTRRRVALDRLRTSSDALPASANFRRPVIAGVTIATTAFRWMQRPRSLARTLIEKIPTTPSPPPACCYAGRRNRRQKPEFAVSAVHQRASTATRQRLQLRPGPPGRPGRDMPTTSTLRTLPACWNCANA